MEKKLMLIGEKESFLIRALQKKLTENGIEAFYCPPDVDELDKNWELKCISAYYMNDGESIPGEVMHYLKEHLTESGEQIIFIGDKADTDPIRSIMHSTLIRECYPRPLDSDKLIKDIGKYMKAEDPTADRKRIMVVDDDTEYLALIRDWLKDSYRVFMASSGIQAIKSLGVNKVDLILLDYQMPVTSGPQVLEMIRSDDDTRDIPVFFLTGRNDKDSVMQVIDLKPEGYLLKTIRKDALLAKLEEFFAK